MKFRIKLDLDIDPAAVDEYPSEVLAKEIQDCLETFIEMMIYGIDIKSIEVKEV